MRDRYGYKKENPIHRIRAYNHIYLKNRKKYPLSWGAYEVHHIDGNRNNNRMDNLAVLTPEEHDKAHDKINDRIHKRKLILFWIIALIVTSPFWITILIFLIKILFGSHN